MYRYEGNKGAIPKLGDRVKAINSGVEYDGLRGTIGGFGYNALTAFILLETPLQDGSTIVSWPIVCLKPTVSKEFEQKWAPFTEPDWSFKKTNLDNLCFEIDSDGYTIWGGGDRPVDGNVVIAVKVRGNIPRSPVEAKYWPQITWRHRAPDDPMNVWDILAYKVLT